LILATISLIKDYGMHQNTLEPTYLHVYNVESGLWGSTTLVTPVSLLSLEAMNAILKVDGILAFIGTKLEFGLYQTELIKENGGSTSRCWTSLPASTIMSFLGLCLNTDVLGKPEMVFYGSPLVRALALHLCLRSNPDIPFECRKTLEEISDPSLPILLIGDIVDGLGFLHIDVSAHELSEGRKYFNEHIAH
jgi:hypothetical protein